ncbi:MAG: hypothetical protein H7839_18140 [Magnetococcus sp. YQC-5]
MSAQEQNCFSIDIPEGENLDNWLKSEAIKGLKFRLETQALHGFLHSINDNVKKLYLDRLTHELMIISNKGYSAYFLIARDIIKKAVSDNIPTGPGRGLLASSLTAWCLQITDLDPIYCKLQFELSLNNNDNNSAVFEFDTCCDRGEYLIHHVLTHILKQTESECKCRYHLPKSKKGEIVNIGTSKFVFKDVCDLTMIFDIEQYINVTYEKSANKKLNMRNLGFDGFDCFKPNVNSNSETIGNEILAFRLDWLKTHYPLPFMASVLQINLGNAKKQVKFLEQCQSMNISVLPPDINKSYSNFTIENIHIRFGLSGVNNVEREVAEIIVLSRCCELFSDLFALCSVVVKSNFKIKKIKRNIKSLIKSGACDCFGFSQEKMLEILPNTLKKAYEINST